jgi:prepilin-type N-terminal cleavage/methylation domain-containing protein
MKNITKKGFSLIELLVVVAIIGILAGIAIVGYNSYVDSAKDSVNDANSSQLARKIAVEKAKPTDFPSIANQYPNCETGAVPTRWANTADLVNAAACWAKAQNFANLENSLTTTPAAGNLSIGSDGKVYWTKIDGTVQPGK